MQDVFVWLPPTPIINEPSKLGYGQILDVADHRWGLQMLPRLQGENCASVSEVVGFMMNLELALHVVVLKGQQGLVNVQPSVHFSRQISVRNLSSETGKAYIVLGSNLLIINGRRGKADNLQSHQSYDRSHVQ